MKTNQPTFSQRMFRGLLLVMPFDFRANYGGEMENVFAEQRRDIQERGRSLDFLRLWAETLAGIFQTAPREHGEILKQDLSYAGRMMRKNPGFTLMATVILALGIGANTAIFSVVHAVLLRPLPYPNGQQLVFIRQQAQKQGLDDIAFSVHEIQDYREQNQTLAGLVEYHAMSFILFGHGDPDRVRSAVVSANYFDLFQVKPLLGRTFVPDDDKLGAPPVLLLRYEYWKNKFGSDPEIVGKTFEMNDKVHTVVGVLPPLPQYPTETDVYMPTSACPFRSSKRMIENRDARMMEVLGRLRPGVSVAQANADFSTIAGRLKSEYPKSYTDNLGYAIQSTPLQEELIHDARPTLLMLLAAAAFVLLIACANVANLMLARMSRRERELAVRTALGAGRSRLLRQLFTESFLIALVGGLLGLTLAYSSLRLLTDFAARLTPRAHEIRIDGHVLTFTLLAALCTSMLFGTLSALLTRANLSSSLKEGSSGAGAGRFKNRVRSALIVSQIAFSFILLIGAGLLLRSLIKIQQVSSGFVPEHVLAMRTTFSFTKYANKEQVIDLIKKVVTRVQSEPGVVSASIAGLYPLEPEAISAGASAFSGPFMIEGRQTSPAEAPPVGNQVIISNDYFRTLGIPLIKGREFADTDDGAKERQVVIINDAMRRQFWPNEDAIGKRVSGDNGETWVTIVGIVGDVREFGLDHPVAPEFYVPQSEGSNSSALIVRTIADPQAMAVAITRAVHQVDPQAAVTHVLTLEQARSESVASPRVTASLLAIFAALALLIAAGGIGGIMALTVSQRVREIGIRLALGARPSRILWMVLSQGLLLASLGVGIGILGALGLKTLLKSLLFGVTPTDPVTFSGVAFVLVASAMIATYLPARRAAAVDPIIALRTE
jgi:putative ABC transport system permease protein